MFSLLRWRGGLKGCATVLIMQIVHRLYHLNDGQDFGAFANKGSKEMDILPAQAAVKVSYFLSITRDFFILHSFVNQSY